MFVGVPATSYESSDRRSREQPSVDADLSAFYPLKRVPDRLPAQANGNRLNPRVPVRWATRGVYGVRLRFICAGRQKLTTDVWLREFCEAVARAQMQAREVQR